MPAQSRRRRSVFSGFGSFARSAPRIRRKARQARAFSFYGAARSNFAAGSKISRVTSLHASARQRLLRQPPLRGAAGNPHAKSWRRNFVFAPRLRLGQSSQPPAVYQRSAFHASRHPALPGVGAKTHSFSSQSQPHNSARRWHNIAVAISRAACVSGKLPSCWSPKQPIPARSQSRSRCVSLPCWSNAPASSSTQPRCVLQVMLQFRRHRRRPVRFVRRKFLVLLFAFLFCECFPLISRFPMLLTKSRGRFASFSAG